MSPSQFRRRKVLIKPSSQLRLALAVFIYVTLYSLLLGLVIFFPLYMEMRVARDIYEQAALSRVVLYLHGRFWVGLVFVAVLGGVHAVFSSHRFVGPMYRFEKMVEALTAGDYSMRIKTRKGDAFKEMEVLLNGLADSIEGTCRKEDAFSQDVKGRIEAVERWLASDAKAAPEEVRARLKEVVRHIDSRGARHGRKGNG
jgi:methyl-accepting chemotaxis protein